MKTAKEFLSQMVDFLNVMFTLTPTYTKKNKVRKVIRVTVEQLQDMLLNWKFGSQPASVQYVTNPYLIPEGKEKFGKVTKIGSASIILGYDYENSVNKQRTREGVEEKFAAQPLWKGYGEVLSSTLAKRKVTKKKQVKGEKFDIETGEVIYYLRYKHEKSLRALHFDSAMAFLPSSLIKPFFKPYYGAKNQGVEKEVVARTLKLENVRRLRFRSMEIQVIPSA